MQGLLLLVFVKHVHLPFIRDIHTHYTRTGLYGYWVRKYLRLDCLGYLCLWWCVPLNGFMVGESGFMVYLKINKLTSSETHLFEPCIQACSTEHNFTGLLADIQQLMSEKNVLI